jgi:hypothetical protein
MHGAKDLMYGAKEWTFMDGLQKRERIFGGFWIVGSSA